MLHTLLSPERAGFPALSPPKGRPKPPPAALRKLGPVMCGRIALYTPPSRIARALDAAIDPALEHHGGPSWNVAPSRGVVALVQPRPRPVEPHQAAPTGVSAETPRRLLTEFRWGLVPYWAKDPGIGNRMINARAETLASKGAFKNLLERHRCLVVADGFYEWQANPTTPRRRTPYYFRRADGRPLTLAGLWDTWRDPHRPDDPAAVLRTCTIVTTEAGPDIAFVHDRMPVVVEADDIDRWLDRADQDPDHVAPLLHPSPAGLLVGHQVDTGVNNPRNDSPDLIEEVDPEGGGDADDPAEPEPEPEGGGSGAVEQRLF